MNMPHRRPLPREEIEDLIRYLAEKYPATFFVGPQMKVPLKKNIVADLEKDKTLDDERREAAVSFYTRDWNYENKLLAGAARVDLNGKKVGVVTAAEQREAQERVQAQILEQRARRAKEQGPVAVAQSLHDAGHIPTDALSKIPAPPTKPIIKLKTTEPKAAELSRLYTLLQHAENVLLETKDETLRAALTTATLKVLIDEVENIIRGLGQKE